VCLPLSIALTVV